MSISRIHRLPAQGGNRYRDFRSLPFDKHYSNDNSKNGGSGNSHDFRRKFYDQSCSINTGRTDVQPPLKRRKSSACACEESRVLNYWRPNTMNTPSTNTSFCPIQVRKEVNAYTCHSFESKQLKLEDGKVFMSRDEIERCSPSRKDGIDLQREVHLRHSYCTFIQILGMRLELPHTTIATAMVLCHRFFLRRSHACHDRFVIATAGLFLASKSEETPRPLNTVLKLSYEICAKQNAACLFYYLPADWFEQFRERVLAAEQMILTTLDFELNVQHPYIPLTSGLNKLGLSQTTVLVNLAWNLVNEGLKSSLWLQFKPHHIAAGAAFLAAKFLNFDLSCCQSMWQEFQTTPDIVKDVTIQLMELL